MPATTLDCLPLYADRDFRDRRSLYSPSGSPAPIVQVVQRPLSTWDLISWMGGRMQTVRIKIDELNDGRQEESYSYVIKNGEVASAAHERASGSDHSLPAKLDLIRLQFGIGTKHLAEALGVERPTVYAWQKEASKPQDKRRDRIEALVELAKYWKSLSERSLGKRAFEPVENGQSVMDVLKEDALNLEQAKNMLRKWAESQVSAKARLKSKAAAMRAAMEKRGVKPLSDAAIDSTLREFAKTSI
jgi:DNA-binding transcriptional regulator YiaG